MEKVFKKSKDGFREIEKLESLHGEGRLVFRNGSKLDSRNFRSGFVVEGKSAVLHNEEEKEFYMGTSTVPPSINCLHVSLKLGVSVFPVREFSLLCGKLSNILKRNLSSIF